VKREYLSLEDHWKVADELRLIDAAWNRIIKLCNGKVPVHLLDTACGLGTRQQQMVMFRFREDCYKEMRRRHGDVPDVYFTGPDILRKVFGK